MGGLSVPCTYHLSIIFQELLCRVAAATAAISKDADQLFTCRRNITDQYLWINFSSISHVYKITQTSWWEVFKAWLLQPSLPPII